MSKGNISGALERELATKILADLSKVTASDIDDLGRIIQKAIQDWLLDHSAITGIYRSNIPPIKGDVGGNEFK